MIRALWWVEEGRLLLDILFQDINSEVMRGYSLLINVKHTNGLTTL